jgi:hypothetical protein
MDLDQCATRVLEGSEASRQSLEQDPLRRDILTWIGKVDPVSGACDRSGAVGVIESMINAMEPIENGYPIVYTLDRNVGKGGRGNAVWCKVVVTSPSGIKVATTMTVQQVIYGHRSYRWRGLLPLWRGTTKEHNVYITRWALLSRRPEVCRAMWNSQDPRCVAKFENALRKGEMTIRHRAPAAAAQRVDKQLAALLLKYGGGQRKRPATQLALIPSPKRPRTEVPSEVPVDVKVPAGVPAEVPDGPEALNVCPLARKAYRDALNEVRKQETHLGGAGDDFIEQLASAAVEELRGIRSARVKHVATMLREARAHRANVEMEDLVRAEVTTDGLIFKASELQHIISRRYKRLLDVLESSDYKELRAIVQVGIWGSFDANDLRRALLQDHTSTTGIRKTWDTLMPLVNNHQDPIVIWRRGKPVLNKAAAGYKHLVEHFGPAVRKLVVQKRMELERHNPSGMYPTAYFRRPGTVTDLNVSDVLAMIAAVVG